MFGFKPAGSKWSYIFALLAFGVGSCIPALLAFPSLSEDGPFGVAQGIQWTVFTPLVYAKQTRFEVEFPEFYDRIESRINRSFFNTCLYFFAFSLVTSTMAVALVMIPMPRWLFVGLFVGIGLFASIYFISSIDYVRRAQEARRLFEPAELGDAEVQRELGLALIRQGGRKACKEAAKWLRSAAGQGNAKAQWSLGNLYFTGKGVSRDFAEAYLWYSISSMKWHNHINKDLLTLAAQKLSPQALNQAQERAQKLYEEIQALTKKC